MKTDEIISKMETYCRKKDDAWNNSLGTYEWKLPEGLIGTVFFEKYCFLESAYFSKGIYSKNYIEFKELHLFIRSDYEDGDRTGSVSLYNENLNYIGTVAVYCMTDITIN